MGQMVRDATVLANGYSALLQDAVTHEAAIDIDGYGMTQYAPAVSRQAIVEMKQMLRRLSNGTEVLQRATVTFLYPIDGYEFEEPPFVIGGGGGEVGGPGVIGGDGSQFDRRDPIDPRDRLVLPDGTTGPILDVSGLCDPSTSAPFFLTVVLG